MKATIERIRGEFLEMPGLRLTVQQVERLCGVERTMCLAVLEVLVESKFLCVKVDGTYARLTEGHLGLPRPSSVDLTIDTSTLDAARR